MAAPAAVEQTLNKPTNIFLNPFHIRKDSESLSADSGKLQDYVVDFLEKEVGSDLKSLKNVGDLLKKISEENNALEGQVNTCRHC